MALTGPSSRAALATVSGRGKVPSSIAFERSSSSRVGPSARSRLALRPRPQDRPGSGKINGSKGLAALRPGALQRIGTSTAGPR
jgi:hypothetical protein